MSLFYLSRQLDFSSDAVCFGSLRFPVRSERGISLSTDCGPTAVASQIGKKGAVQSLSQLYTCNVWFSDNVHVPALVHAPLMSLYLHAKKISSFRYIMYMYV